MRHRAPGHNNPTWSVPVPPSRYLHTRFTASYSGEPLVEVWENGARIYPPPYLVKRANSSRNDSYYRVGDTMSWQSVSRSDLHLYGFSDSDQSIFSEVLLFLLGIGVSNDIRILHVIKRISPSGFDPWKGTIEFRDFVLAGSVLIPTPRQPSPERHFDELLAFWARTAVNLDLLMQAMDAWFSLMISVAIAVLTEGGSEAAEAASEELVRKYYVRGVLYYAGKWLRPKFLAIVKGYMEGFVKELALQLINVALIEIRRSVAAERVAAAPAGSSRPGSITINQLEALQTAAALNKLDPQINWERCNEKGLVQTFDPFLNLLSGLGLDRSSKLGPLMSSEGLKHIREQFFTKGLFVEITRKGGTIRKLVEEAIASGITSVTGAVIEEAKRNARPGQPGETSELSYKEKVGRSVFENLNLDAVIRYVENNWETLAKRTLDAAEEAFAKAAVGSQKEE